MTDTDILYMAAQEKRITDLENENRELKKLLKAKELKELRESVGAVKLSSMKEALALIRTLKAELNGWKDNPFVIIAEVCGLVTDCKRCQWDGKCPYTRDYEGYPWEWRDL
jgi:hypothetical protein